MKETTRVTTIEITEIIKGTVGHSAEDARRMWLDLIGKKDDVHVTVQDFVGEVLDE